MRLELTRVGLLVELANHYTTRGVMLKGGILVAKQLLTQQPKSSSDLQRFALVLTGLNGRSERPSLNNRLLMSSPSTHVIIPTVFFKLLFWQTYTRPYFKGGKSQWLRVNYAKIVILETV